MGVDDPAITSALDKLEHEDPAAARRAGAALDWLTAGHGLALLTQARIQAFLWHELPTKWLSDLDQQQDVASALARAFDHLEVHRYAAICRSATTREILEAYERGTRTGREAFYRADAASGVRPGHLPEFEWGNAMGVLENRARNSTGAYLELAIAAGELVPGGRGWKEQQRELVRTHITASRPEFRGTSFIELIRQERLRHWLGGRHSEKRRALFEPLVEYVRQPAALPEGAGDPLPPVTWLLERLVEGQPLTETGNLKRAFVQEAAKHFDWWDPDLPILPRSENDLVALALTQQLLKSLGLSRRSGKKLVLTTRGQAALAEPVELWRAVARALIPTEPFRRVGGELALALLLTSGAAGMGHDRLVAEAIEILTEEGWRDHRTQQPPDAHAIWFAMDETLGLLRALNLLTTDRDAPETSFALTEVGRATALEALHYRATGPAGGPYG